MLKFELVKNQGDLVGKRFLYSNTEWEDNLSGFEMFDELGNYEIMDKLNNVFIRISCDDDQHFVIEPIRKKNIQFTGRFENNKHTGELYLYRNKPRELYINVSDQIRTMSKSDKLSRTYLLKVIDNNESKVEYHGIIVGLTYKNNGKINNENFDFDISIYSHELKTVNIITNLINISFIGVLILWIISIISKEFTWSVIDYAVIVVILTYIRYTYLRFKHIKNTFINKVCKYYRTKKINRFSKRSIENRILSNYETLQEKNKDKPLQEL